MAEYHELTGIAHFPYFDRPDRQFIPESSPELGGKFKVSLELSGAELQKAKDLGFDHLLFTKDGKGKGDTGEPYTYITISAREFIKDRSTGDLTARPAIEVVDENGDPVEGMVGNGSKITVKFNRYQGYAKRYFAGLTKVMVHEMVEYIPEETTEAVAS